MAKIEIRGVIVSNDDAWIYEWVEIEHTSPQAVQDAIKDADGADLEVIINSTGGDVWAGSEIYTDLMSYKGHVEVKIVGVAASAASIVAMAGKKVLMSPTAEMMIHNVISWSVGDYRDMEHEAKVLKDYSSTIANAYMIKTKMSKKDLLAMMDEETWLTPEKALELGFIDEIMFMENKPRLVASKTSKMIPPEVINKMRNMLKEGKEPEGKPKEETQPSTEILKAKLALECEL